MPHSETIYERATIELEAVHSLGGLPFPVTADNFPSALYHLGAKLAPLTALEVDTSNAASVANTMPNGGLPVISRKVHVHPAQHSAEYPQDFVTPVVVYHRPIQPSEPRTESRAHELIVAAYDNDAVLALRAVQREGAERRKRVETVAERLAARQDFQYITLEDLTNEDPSLARVDPKVFENARWLLRNTQATVLDALYGNVDPADVIPNYTDTVLASGRGSDEQRALLVQAQQSTRVGTLKAANDMLDGVIAGHDLVYRKACEAGLDEDALVENLASLMERLPSTRNYRMFLYYQVDGYMDQVAESAINAHLREAALREAAEEAAEFDKAHNDMLDLIRAERGDESPAPDNEEDEHSEFTAYSEGYYSGAESDDELEADYENPTDDQQSLPAVAFARLPAAGLVDKARAAIKSGADNLRERLTDLARRAAELLPSEENDSSSDMQHEQTRIHPEDSQSGRPRIESNAPPEEEMTIDPSASQRLQEVALAAASHHDLPQQPIRVTKNVLILRNELMGLDPSLYNRMVDKFRGEGKMIRIIAAVAQAATVQKARELRATPLQTAIVLRDAFMVMSDGIAEGASRMAAQVRTNAGRQYSRITAAGRQRPTLSVVGAYSTSMPMTPKANPRRNGTLRDMFIYQA